MTRDSLDDLEVLFAVAREGSFTRAAATLGVSPSALSQKMRAIETRLGLRLLNRSTRSVALTPAGEQLIRAIAPRFEEIRDELSDLSRLRNRPSGTIRITASEYVSEAIIAPVLTRFLPEYPEITVEVIVDHGLTDIVAQRYDAGVRLGDVVEKDMIAVPISGDQRRLVVAAPKYVAEHGAPHRPQELARHRCINLRLPTRESLYVWEFEKGARRVKVRVEGQMISNTLAMIVRAAVAGLGFAYLPAEMVRTHLASGSLCAVL